MQTCRVAVVARQDVAVKACPGGFGCVMVRPVVARFCRQVPVGLARAWQGGVRFVPLWYGEAVMVWWCVFRCGEVSSGGAWQVI